MEFIPKGEVPTQCPICGSELEVENDIVKDGFTSTLVCTNPNCNFEKLWSHDTEEEIRKQMNEEDGS